MIFLLFLLFLLIMGCSVGVPHNSLHVFGATFNKGIKSKKAKVVNILKLNRPIYTLCNYFNIIPIK